MAPTGLLNDQAQGPSPKAMALVNDPNYIKSRIDLAEYTLQTVDLDEKSRSSWKTYLGLLQQKLTQLQGAAPASQGAPA